MAQIDHTTAGRVNVVRGEGSITLRLWHYSAKGDATLSFAEAEKLIRYMQAAMKPEKATRPITGTRKPTTADDDPDDIG